MRVYVTMYDPELEEGEFWFDDMSDDGFDESWMYTDDWIEHNTDQGYITMVEFLEEDKKDREEDIKMFHKAMDQQLDNIDKMIEFIRRI